MNLFPSKKRKEISIEDWLKNAESICPSCEFYGNEVMCGMGCTYGDMYSPKEGEEYRHEIN